MIRAIYNRLMRDRFMYEHFIGEYRRHNKYVRWTIDLIDNEASGKSKKMSDEDALKWERHLERDVYDAKKIMEGLENNAVYCGRRDKIKRVLDKKPSLMYHAERALVKHRELYGLTDSKAA